MTSQIKLSENTSQSFITVSSDELKNIFGDNDVERLEYPVGEFPTSKTQIIMVFSQKSGKKSQYIELQEWLNLLEKYKQTQQLEQLDKPLSDLPFLDNIQSEEHGKSFVCIVSFQINDDEDNVNQIVVTPEERDDCVNIILENYPQDSLDISVEFMCKQCFQKTLLEDMEEEFDNYGGSKMIH